MTSWLKIGKNREKAASHRKNADALRTRLAELGAPGRGAAQRLAEARVAIAELDRNLSGQLHNHEAPLGRPPRRRPARYGEQIPPLPGGFKVPDELAVEAQRLRSEAKALIASPKARMELLREAYAAETLAAENRLRLKLFAVDKDARASLKPELEKLRAELVGQVAVLSRELDHESRPLQDLRAEIARLDQAAEVATADADRLEGELLGLPDENVSSASGAAPA